jgi:hypothetical protein
MSNALKSFIGGMAGGYINETRRQEDRARQDKLDLMREQEFNLRKRQLEGQIDDQDSERAIKKSLLEADQDLPEAQDGTAVQVGGVLSGNTDAESAANSAQAVRDANAQLSPQDQIPQAEATPIKAVGSKTFLATPGGLKAAEAYRTEGNTEEGRIKRKAEAIRQLRGSEAAQKFMTDWTTNQEALHQAQISTIRRVGLEKITARDYAGFADLYSKYDDGKEIVFEPGQGGGGTFAIYQGDPKDGKRIGAIDFKDQDEAARKFVDLMDPVGAVKRREEMAKESKLDSRWTQEFDLRKKTAEATISNLRASAGRAARSDDPLYGFNKAKIVFKAAYGREPTQEEAIKLAGLGADSYEKSDAQFASDIVKAGATAGTVMPEDAAVKRNNIITQARDLRKTPNALPPGLVVGAASKQADGVYSARGKQVTIQGGKVTEIK